jgi:hypothetical protein
VFDEQIFPATTVICYNFDIGPPMHHHSHVWFIFNLWFPRRFKIYIFSYIYRPNQHNQHTYNFTEYPRKYVKQLTMKLHFDCQFILIYIVTVFCLFVCFVLLFFLVFFFQQLDFYSASPLKQQYAGRHVAPLGHIILFPSQPVFALTP